VRPRSSSCAVRRFGCARETTGRSSCSRTDRRRCARDETPLRHRTCATHWEPRGAHRTCSRRWRPCRRLPSRLGRSPASETPLPSASSNVRRSHRLAHALHARGERLVGAAELLKRPARDLHDGVVDARLEARRSLARDVVVDLVERVAHSQLGRNLGDREPVALEASAWSGSHAGSSR